MRSQPWILSWSTRMRPPVRVVMGRAVASALAPVTPAKARQVSVARQRQRTAEMQTSSSLMSLICTVNVRNQEELMLRKSLMLATAAGALIMVQGAANAQAECGGIWAGRCNAPKGQKSKPADKKANDAAPAANASPNAEENASTNSAVAGATPPKAS